MNRQKVLYLILGILTLFLAIFPRITEVLNHNYVFTFDQGRDYLAVKHIVVDKKFTLIGPEIGAGSAGFSYVFHGPFYYYLLSIPFILFGADPYGGIVTMFVLGALSIILSYYSGGKIFNPLFGFVLAMLVAISPPLIAQSRFFWNSFPATSLIIATCMFVYKINQTRTRYVFLAAFTAGFIYNFELAMSVPLGLAVLLYMIFVNRSKSIKHYLAFLGGSLIAYLPMILFEIKHGFLATKNILIYLFLHPSKTEKSFSIVNKLTDQLKSFEHNFIDSFPNQTIIPDYLFLFVIFGASFYFVLKEQDQNRKNFIIFLLSLPLISFFVFSFVRSGVWNHYLFHLTVSYLFLFGYILHSSFQKKFRAIQVVLSAIFLLFFSIAIPSAINTFKNDYKDHGGISKIKGKIETLDYIYQDAKGEKFGLLVFSPPVYTYPYDYVIWWYGRSKYGYEPYAEKKGLFYLWIEKDAAKPWTYQGWLETIVKTGKILKTEELPNGFIVQKRLVE